MTLAAVSYKLKKILDERKVNMDDSGIDPGLFEKWEKLDLTEDPKKIRDWKSNSKNVLAMLEKGNVGLIADTAAGKTIVGGCYRSLFLAPQRILVHQHYELIEQISKGSIGSRAITGETSAKNHVWNDRREQIIFATPHIALIDLNKKILDLKGFDLLILDEFHKAAGNYPYVVLAKLAERAGLKILGLTASPGGNLADIEKIKANCRLHELVRVEIDTPPKLQNVLIAEMDENLAKMDKKFNILLDRVKIELLRLTSCQIKDGDPLKEERLGELEDKIKGLWFHDREAYYRSILLLAKYRKLHHAYLAALTECYATFLKYAEKLGKDQSKSARQIVSNPGFLELVQLAEINIDSHPKVLLLDKVLQSWIGIRRNGIVFVYEKKTANYLKAYFNLKGFRTEILFGGRDKKVKHQKETLDLMARRELDLIFATSVIEEGVSVPEVDAIFQYSMPQTGISSIQRRGRTGRKHAGNIFYIMLDHSLDISRYWKSCHEIRTMISALKKSGEETAVRKKPVQLSLFPSFFKYSE